MADSRATLKAFFETGDIPTQAQFASLIDSLLSLEDDSNLKNGLKIKSATNGKLQFVYNDTGYEITTDGSSFAESGFIFQPSFVELATNGETVGLFITGGLNENVRLRGNPTSVDPSFFAIGDEANLFITRGLAITEKSLKQIALIPSFDDDADAGTGGLTTGDFYQTTGLGSAPLNAAGIVMLKQ